MLPDEQHGLNSPGTWADGALNPNQCRLSKSQTPLAEYRLEKQTPASELGEWEMKILGAAQTQFATFSRVNLKEES